MVFLIVVFGLLVWSVADVVLMVFAGMLIAIFLRGLGDGLASLTGLSESLSLTLVLFALVGAVTLGAILLGSETTSQLDQLGPSLRSAWEATLDLLYRYEWGRILFSEGNVSAILPAKDSVLAGVTGVFSTTLGALAGFFIALSIGIYAAFAPQTYRGGLLWLFPAQARPRAREVLDELGRTMRWWLIGTFARMTFVGIAVTIGLWLLDVRLALALGLMAFILDFVPYLGPILAAAPALMVGLSVSPTDALYVLLMFVGVQAAENYIVSPLIDQYAVNLPPALTISSQVLLGALLGPLGVVFATPLTAIAVVLVQTLYVEEDYETETES